MFEAKIWILEAKFWVLAARIWLFETMIWILEAKVWVLAASFWVFEARIWVLKARICVFEEENLGLGGQDLDPPLWWKVRMMNKMPQMMKRILSVDFQVLRNHGVGSLP